MSNEIAYAPDPRPTPLQFPPSRGFSSSVQITGDTMTGNLQVGNTDGTDSFDVRLLTTGGPHFRRRSADVNGETLVMDKRGTTGDRSALVGSGTTLGSVVSNGWDGSDYGEAANILFIAAEAFSTSAHGGRINISTTTPATTTRVERVRVDNTGLDLRNSTPLLLGGAAYFNPLTVYAAGTVYTLTNASAAVTFGTTSPSLTVTAAGTYLLRARVKVNLNGATFAANQTLTVKLRRTNNTATDVTSSSCTWTTPIITTITNTLAVIELPEVSYTTALTNDAVAIFADISTTPSAGTISIDEASIVAIRIS